MKNIKFRAWDETLKKWDYFSLNSIPTYLQTFNFHWLKGDEFYQFTGLLDKNGKEIWEGDIVVPNKNHQIEKTLGIVTWDQFLAQFIIKYKDGTGWRSFSDFEVIGDIYENPEKKDEGRRK